MSAESPSDVPWTTAPELIDDYLERLDIPDDSQTAEDAREYARRCGFEEPIGRSPSAVAAGSIYLAHMFEPARVVTQDEIQEKTGVSPRTVTLAYRDIADAEGIAIAGNASDDADSDEVDTEFGWASIAVAGVIFGLGLAGIVLFWTDVITPLLGASTIALAAMVVPTAIFAVLALEAGLRFGEASAR